MRKILVFQHAAHEILGTLNPLLKREGFRVRYVNFQRTPDLEPTIEKYNGLIILGGHMGVYEADKFPHIKHELKVIEHALKAELPILGICLGSQLIAQALGSNVRKHSEKEIGWYDVELTKEGQNDPLFQHFNRREKIFQMHGDTFDVPKSAIHLAESELCPAQAFRYGDKVYGMQFHLEIDEPMIKRWLKLPAYVKAMVESHGKFNPEAINEDTQKYIGRALSLADVTFTKFARIFGEFDRNELLGSGR